MRGTISIFLIVFFTLSLINTLGCKQTSQEKEAINEKITKEDVAKEEESVESQIPDEIKEKVKEEQTEKTTTLPGQ